MPRTTRKGEPPTEPPPSRDPVDLNRESLTAVPRDATSQPGGGECPDPGGTPSAVAPLSEARLLGLMSAQDVDPDAARDAWEELYRRHVRYIFQVVARGYGDQLGGEDHVSDVVVDTFQTAYDWAGRQACPEEVEARFDDQERDSVRRRVLGWLSVTARRLALHRIKPRRESNAPFHDTASPDIGDSEPASTQLHAALARALAKLTPEEIEALRVSLPWYQPDTGEFAFPRGEAAKAASALGITPDTLRQRRFRSIKRLRSLIVDG